jgi:dephospho-CoA kinase
MSDVLVIGLTGNIATGKSTVTAMLARLGAYTIDADQVVHRMLDTDPGVQSEVAARFGPDVRTSAGTIDRARLGAIVFSSPAGMRDLEMILHPRVGAQVDEMIARCDASVVVVEAIKLLESELHSRCQAIWVTTCQEEDQIQRLVRDRKMTREQALARIRSQPSQAAKVARADVVINTSGTLDQTKEQVEQAWRKLAVGRHT